MPLFYCVIDTPCSTVSIVNFEQVNTGWVCTMQSAKQPMNPVRQSAKWNLHNNQWSMQPLNQKSHHQMTWDEKNRMTNCEMRKIARCLRPMMMTLVLIMRLISVYVTAYLIAKYKQFMTMVDFLREWLNTKTQKFCVAFEDGTNDYISTDNIDDAPINLIWFLNFVCHKHNLKTLFKINLHCVYIMFIDTRRADLKISLYIHVRSGAIA